MTLSFEDMAIEKQIECLCTEYRHMIKLQAEEIKRLLEENAILRGELFDPDEPILL